MSYCRWENTYHDLRDCYDSMRNNDDSGEEDEPGAPKLSKSEEQYKRYLLELCQEIIDFVNANGEEE